MWSYTKWSNEILSRTFLVQSEQMLLVTFLAKYFPFGSAEILMCCKIQIPASSYIGHNQQK